MNKIIPNADEAVKDVFDGATIMVGGFGLSPRSWSSENDPPTFTLFTNKPVPPTYLRYLERKIREHFGFGPTPLKLRVRRRG